MLLAAFGFFVSIAYWPWISGAATTPRWAVLSPIVLLLFFQKIKSTPAHVIGLAFVLWCGLTYLWSASPDDTVGSGLVLVLLAITFCVGAQQTTLRPLYATMAIGLAVSSAIAVAQWLGWSASILGYGAQNNTSGLFVNRNFYAEICALVFVALVGERMWRFLPAVIPGLILTTARGALLAVAVALVVTAWPIVRSWFSRYELRGVLVVGSIVGALLFTLPIHSNGWATITDRLLYWSETLPLVTFAGQGWGAFFASFPHPAGYKFEHPHNEFLEIAYEAGLVGLGLFFAFVVTILRRPFRTETAVFVALMAEAFVEFPLHKPATAFLGAAVAGCLAGSLRADVDQAVSSRDRVRQGLQRAGRRQGISTLPNGKGALSL